MATGMAIGQLEVRGMENALVACFRCGFVARRDSLTEGKRCAECNGPTEDVGLIRARDLVAARRRFDKQKAIRKAVSDLGIRETVT